ncbi:magnesium transporter [Fibrobacterota bacterium]
MPEVVTRELVELISKKKWAALKERLVDVPAPVIQEILFIAEKHDRALIFRSLSRHMSAEVFADIEPEQQDSLLHDLTDIETRQLLSTLPPDDRTALLEELPAPMTRRLFGLLSAEDLQEARQLLGYPEESVGRLMTPDYVEVYPDWTVAKALDHIRSKGKDSETINMVYVVDKTGKLLDDIRLRRIILSNTDTKIEELMDKSFASLSAFEDREKAVIMMRDYDLLALPVIDSDGELIGIVTFDDVMDVAEEEATEDIHKSASVAPLKMSYHRAGVFNLYNKRAGWLVILVLLNLISAGVIAAFEEQLAQTIVLLFFIPILIGTGGNAGAQAATLVIRALVTGDIKLEQWVQTIGKEILVGLLLGVTLGLLGGCLGLLRGDFNWNISLVVGLSMLSIVVVGNLVGMILPFILAKVKIDPAVASGPLITTIADATGLLIYFSIASVIIGW